MSAACEALDADALGANVAEARVADHLAGCAECRQRRAGLLRITALLQREERVPSPRAGWQNRVFEQLDGQRTVGVPSWRWSPRRWVLAGLVPALALAAALLMLKLPGQADPTKGVFAALGRQPRTHPWRLSHALADQHRARQAYRGVGDAPPPGRAVDLEPLERAGDPHLLAAAQLLAGMREQADANLAALPRSADVLNDRAAVLLDRGKPAEALTLLEQARELAAHHPQATWNTGVALRELGKHADAIQWFERAARIADPAWAAEARADAEALRKALP